MGGVGLVPSDSSSTEVLVRGITFLGYTHQNESVASVLKAKPTHCDLYANFRETYTSGRRLLFLTCTQPAIALAYGQPARTSTSASGL